ncbi:MAG: hypothetical protein R3B68_01730 [Phycisphaerales bacterium]
MLMAPRRVPVWVRLARLAHVWIMAALCGLVWWATQSWAWLLMSALPALMLGIVASAPVHLLLHREQARLIAKGGCPACGSPGLDAVPPPSRFGWRCGGCGARIKKRGAVVLASSGTTSKPS